MKNRLITALVASALACGTAAQASVLNSHWKFDEVGGTNADDSVGNFDGTLNGAGASFATGGKLGGRVTLNGTANVVVADTAAHRPATISVSTWVSTTDTGSFRGVWDKVQNGVGFSIFVHGGNAILNLDGSPNLDSGVNVADGSWHQMTGIYEVGLGSRFYVDGVLVGSDATAVYTGNAVTLAFGGDGASSFMITGSMDDTAVWGGALTPGQAIGLYNLADNATLSYDAGEADALFSLHAGGSGSTVVDGRAWHYTTGLSGGVGTVVEDGNGGFFLQLAPDGSGVQTPEPASLAIFAAGVLMIGRRRSRQV